MNQQSTSYASHSRNAAERPSFARAALGFSGSIALLCVAALALSFV